MTMNNNTVSREAFDGFSGLGLSPRGKTSCRLDNFRVLADGSIEKREGMRHLASLPSALRGVYAFQEDGKDVILAVTGNQLHRILKNGERLSTECFSTEKGEVGFFVYGGRLYLLDGAEIYRYEGKGVAQKIHGYTPLYGKDWDIHDVSNREVYEPVNCLSPHVRIHYHISNAIGSLYVGFVFEAIDWVRADGVLIDSTRYSINSAKDGINFQPLLFGNDFEISITLLEKDYKDKDFSSCLAAATYEDFANSRVFFYSGNDAARFFVSRKLDVAVQNRDRALFPSSCGLYFPKESAVSLGDGRSITAIQRVFDRAVFFTSSSVWASEPLSEVEGDEILFSPICGHLGCHAAHAIVMTGASSPVSVAQSGIYLWKIDPDLLEECTTTCLSSELGSLLEDRFFAEAGICHHRRRGELWFYKAGDKDGRVFLYSLDRKMWYCYSGILADRMFMFDGGVAFAKGNEVFLFDETISADCLKDGEVNIEAVFESGWLDFGCADTDKRLENILLTAELSGGEISVELLDGEPLGEEIFLKTDAVPSGVYDRRAPTGRFRAAKLRLCACGPRRERIYRAELVAQKGKK